MTIRVLLRDYPHRAIALATSDYALIFRHTSTDNNASASSLSLSTTNTGNNASTASTSAPRCMVEFSALDSVDLAEYRSLSTLSAQGTLGLITLGRDVFLCVVNGSTKVASVRLGESVYRISSVEFQCLNSANYDQILHNEINPYPIDGIAEDGFDHGYGHGHRDPILEHPCLALKKLLSSGTFYYSIDFDLTSRLQDRSVDASKSNPVGTGRGFLWNSYMIQPLLNFRSRLASHEREALDASGILTNAIRGFVSTVTIPASSSPLRTQRTGLPSALTLISRLSCRRAGTRFNARGIDDHGNVANFVETETVFWSPTGICFSYVQARGSVPAFWEQATGLLPGQQKIQITRSPEATQPAFDKHFEDLELNYGAVHILNLLSKDKAGEVDLSRLYRFLISHSSLNNRSENGGSPDRQLLKITEYDFHAETREGGYQAASLIKRYIQDSAESFAYYLCEEVEDHPKANGASVEKALRRQVVVLQQEGVFRTNCLDCLDRTNLVQTIVSQMAIEAFLGHHSERASSDFWMRHGGLWADNGDALSRIYAGTGALKSSFTRHGKMSLAGALADVRKSATRLYINNFEDKGRQNTIDVLLGRLVGQTPVHLYDPLNEYVTSELSRRAAEYTSPKTINIWAGTFNLNGKAQGITDDLSSWLCPAVDPSLQNPELVVVGLQEIVELSPQHIMSTDPTRRQAWEDAVKRTLNEYAQKHGFEEYVLLRGGQLVGTSLSIFVRASALPAIKDVEGSLKKTGMSGMAGNKGAVAIRMDYDSTSICFVTAHLAAGFANYEERNRDYKTISHGLHFQRNRFIEDHDTVIWLGDFNYRIGLSNERVREYIKLGDLDKLYENDQLNLQMVAGLTFPYYSEARITFMPTYKYDVGTDSYDSSEKPRIPAWCDRILRKGNNLRQIHYDTAPLRFSDHRPVYATFQCTISAIDEQLKERMSRELYRKRKAFVGNTTANGNAEDTDDEDLIGYDSIEPGLPPASSDRRKWWLDNGAPVRSEIKPPDGDHVANPNRPSNPFAQTTEPDWVRRTDALPQATALLESSNSPALAANGRNGAQSDRINHSIPQFSTPSAAAGQRPASSTRNLSTQSVGPSLRLHASPSALSARQTLRKPAPLVPKKPAVLSSLSSSPSSPLQVCGVGASPAALAAAPALQVGASRTANEIPLPPPPRRSVNQMSQQSSREGTSTLRQTSKVLRKPAPNIMDDKPSLIGPGDNLMDGGKDELSGWKPLIPKC